MKELECLQTQTTVVCKKMNNEALALGNVDRDISNQRLSKTTLEKEYLLQYNEIQQNMRVRRQTTCEEISSGLSHNI